MPKNANVICEGSLTKFKSQGLYTIKIKYWNASGSGFPPSLIPVLRNIGILHYKKAKLPKHLQHSVCNTWWFSKRLEAASKLRQHFWSVLSSTGPSRNARAQLSFVEPYEWVSVCSSACYCCCCCYTISLMTSSQDKANDSGVSLHAREIEYLFRRS